MANKTQTYLLFTIGPVQEFLAAARKTSDLYSGSLLLSHLMQQAVQVIDSKDVNIFYPVFDKGKKTDIPEFSALSNRIFCRVDGDEKKAMKIAADAEKRVKDFFRTEVGAEAMNSFVVSSRDRVWVKLWQEQLEKFLEFYYVAYQPQDNETHDKCYRRLEYLLACRKLLRNFCETESYDRHNKKYIPGQPEQKCTLILHHTALHTENQRPREFWQAQIRQTPGVYRRGERLSAIAVTKRKFIQHERFTPTNTIAAGGFYRAFLKAWSPLTELQEAAQEYVEKIGALTKELNVPPIGNFPSLVNAASPELIHFLTIDTEWLDSDIYQAEGLAEEYGKDEQTLEPLVQEAGKSRTNLFKKIRDFNRQQGTLAIPPPGKYYAIIAFDGDEMGKWLSGAMKSDDGKEFPANEDNHSKFSQTLHAFATSIVPEIFHGQNSDGEPRLGRLIYAGGDDILAFCALEDLFEILSHLNTEFRKTMNTVTGSFAQATASTGVAIAHPRTALQQVLQEARDAMQFAKKKLERNSLAFSLIRRSGEKTTAGMTWDHTRDDKKFDNLEALWAFAKHVQEGVISTSFLYDLKSESTGLAGLTSPEDVEMEIRRLLKRHSGQSQEDKSKAVSLFEKRLKPFYETLDVTNLALGETAISRLVSLLEVAQFTGRGGIE